ncbi:MAG: nuclear transport factor 2 family protein [Ignavibacteria bacterium]|nr:nuclear transport factor 2 family protein [Ignavibacteria bacterium]
MSKMMSVLLALVLLSWCVVAQDKPDVEKDKAAVKQAAHDYAEGYYEGSAERMERALHPLLVKRGLVPSSQPGSTFLVQMNSVMLVEVTRSGRGKLAPEERGISYELLDLTENTASAKIFTARFNDFLHLAKQNGQWRIVNVLWRPPAQQPSGDAQQETDAIKKVMTVLRDGTLAKDAEAVQRVLHPEIARRAFVQYGPGGNMVVQEANGEVLLEVVRSGRAAQQLGQIEPEVTVLEVYEDIGSVKITTPRSVDYVHLAKQDGQWRVVNGLLAMQAAPSQPSK